MIRRREVTSGEEGRKERALLLLLLLLLRDVYNAGLTLRASSSRSRGPDDCSIAGNEYLRESLR